MRRPDWQAAARGLRAGLARLRPGRRTAKWYALALAALLVLPPLTGGIALRALYAGHPAADAVTRGRDAVWLGHAWVDGRKDAAGLGALKRRIAGTGIRDLYVHAGPLEHDGTLPAPAYAKAGWFLRAVHRELPGVRVQAWLGDRLDSEGGTGLHLADARAREAVAASGLQVLRAGFDGVHLDLEPLHSGDRDFLALLDDLRPRVHARGGVLSVATHQIDPLPATHTVAGALTGHPKWWSQRYFGAVARRVDQAAVMAYDTAMPLESLFGGYTAHQTALALDAAPPGTDLLIGLPFFHDDTPGHHASAETVPAAVRGVRLALTRTDRGRTRFGVALYVDFAATAADWNAYRRAWGRPGGS